MGEDSWVVKPGSVETEENPSGGNFIKADSASGKFDVIEGVVVVFVVWPLLLSLAWLLELKLFLVL